MIPAYPLFAAGLGITWCLTPASLLGFTPTFDFIDDYVPIWIFGVMLIMMASQMFYTALKADREQYMLGLQIFEYFWGLWALIVLGSFFFGDSTFAGWMWPAFVAYAARTSRKSLEILEVQPFTEPTFQPPS